jgi:hypothetical protein
MFEARLDEEVTKLGPGRARVHPPFHRYMLSNVIRLTADSVLQIHLPVLLVICLQSIGIAPSTCSYLSDRQLVNDAVPNSGAASGCHCLTDLSPRSQFNWKAHPVPDRGSQHSNVDPVLQYDGPWTSPIVDTALYRALASARATRSGAHIPLRRVVMSDVTLVDLALYRRRWVRTLIDTYSFGEEDRRYFVAPEFDRTAGIYTVMVIMTLYYLFRRGNAWSQHRLTISYTITMFCITVAWYYSQTRIDEALTIETLAGPGVSSQISVGESCGPLDNASSTLSTLQFWGNDILMVRSILRARGIPI